MSSFTTKKKYSWGLTIVATYILFFSKTLIYWAHETSAVFVKATRIHLLPENFTWHIYTYYSQVCLQAWVTYDVRNIQIFPKHVLVPPKCSIPLYTITVPLRGTMQCIEIFHNKLLIILITNKINIFMMHFQWEIWNKAHVTK